MKCPGLRCVDSMGSDVVLAFCGPQSIADEGPFGQGAIAGLVVNADDWAGGSVLHRGQNAKTASLPCFGLATQLPTFSVLNNACHVPLARPHDPTETPLEAPEVVFLGTGTSVGVPAIGCACEVCQSTDPRNNRTRCAVVFRLPQGDLLIDTPPDLRTQLLRERIGLINAVLFTHEHADHMFGLDDLRLFPFRLNAAVPVYCQANVEERIRKSFDYAFSDRPATHPGSRPQLEIRNITHEPFEALGVRVTPIPMQHGPHFEVLGFRIGNFAYCTDTNHIGPESLALLQGLDTLVLGALRHSPHPTHFSVNEAVAVAQQLSPKQTYLTHVSHDLDHGPICEELPEGIDLAYDGLRVPL